MAHKPKRQAREAVPKGYRDEITTNTYECLERIEAGNYTLGSSGFRICIDGICYVRCIKGNKNYLIIHAFRTSESNSVEMGGQYPSGRKQIYTSAFRACMLNVNHGAALISLGVIGIELYIALNRLYDRLEYYESALPRFIPGLFHKKCRNPIKYVIAARMYMNGMSIDEISKLLRFKFRHDMKLVTE